MCNFLVYVSSGNLTCYGLGTLNNKIGFSWRLWTSPELTDCMARILREFFIFISSSHYIYTVVVSLLKPGLLDFWECLQVRTVPLELDWWLGLRLWYMFAIRKESMYHAKLSSEVQWADILAAKTFPELCWYLIANVTCEIWKLYFHDHFSKLAC